MEWIDYILTAIIGAGVGTLFGYLLENWRHRKEIEQARVGRILQPLRELASRLMELQSTYETHDYQLFYSRLEQVNRIIGSQIAERGLGWDIVKESKNMVENLFKLNQRHLVLSTIHLWRQRQIKEDNKESSIRLSIEYQIELFRDEQIRNLVRLLTDELGKWLREHS